MTFPLEAEGEYSSKSASSSIDFDATSVLLLMVHSAFIAKYVSEALTAPTLRAE